MSNQYNTFAYQGYAVSSGTSSSSGGTTSVGAAGATGLSATITVGSTTTSAPSSLATVVNTGSSSAAVLQFSIPAGLQGSTGASGSAASITVGSTTTTPPSSLATVVNTGTSSAAVLQFSIPMGATGPVGSQGPAGLGVSSGSQIGCISLTAATGVFNTLIAATGFMQSIQGYSNAMTMWGAAPLTLQPLGGGAVSTSGQPLLAGAVSAPSATITSLVAGTGAFTTLSAGTGSVFSLSAATGTFNQLLLTGSGTQLSLGNSKLSVGGLALTQQTPITFASGASGSSSSTLASDSNGSLTASGGLTLGGNLTGTSAAFSGSLTAQSLSSATAAATSLAAGTGSFISLSAGTGSFSALSSSTVSAATGSYTAGVATARLTATAASVSSLQAATGSFTTVLLNSTGGTSTLTADATGQLSASGGLTLGGNLTGTSVSLSSGLSAGANITGTTLTLSGTGSATTLAANTVKAQFITASGSFVSQGSANFSTLSTSGVLQASQIQAGTGTFISLIAATGAFNSVNVVNTTNTAGNIVLGQFVSPISGTVSNSEVQVQVSGGNGLYVRGGFQQGVGTVASMGLSNSGTDASPFMTLGSSGVPSFPNGLSAATGVYVGGRLTTSTSTLDDGSGNMTVAATGTFSNVLVNNTAAVLNLKLNSGSATNTLTADSFGAASLVNSGGTASMQLNPSVQTAGQYFTDTVAGDSLLRGFAGSTLRLGVGNANSALRLTTTTVKTATSTLDDGSGNMNLSGYLVARGALSFPAQLAVGLGTDSGNTRGYVQASNGAATVAPLILNPNGGKLSSQNSTIDDGSGNATFAGTLTVSNASTTPSMPLLSVSTSSTGATGSSTIAKLFESYLGGGNTVSMQVGVNSLAAASLGYTNAVGNAAAATYGIAGSTQAYKVSYGGVASTLNNTLDDGKGNMVVAATGSFTNLQTGSLNAASASVSGNLYANSVSTYGCYAPGGQGITFAYPGQNDANLRAYAYVRLHGDSSQSQDTNYLVLGGYRAQFNTPVYSQNSTLDDGSGKMSISPGSGGVSKLSLFGSISAATGFYYGFGATNSQLQYNTQGGHAWFSQTTASGAQTPLMALSSSGALTTTTAAGTTRNTLDDSNGNVSIVSSNATAYGLAALSVMNPTLQVAPTNYGLSVNVGRSAAVGQCGTITYTYNYTGSGTGTTGSYQNSNQLSVGIYGARGITLSGAGKVSAGYNVLDDGLGNMAVNTALTVGSGSGAPAILQSNSSNTSGTPLLTLPSATGTLALTPTQAAFYVSSTNSTGIGLSGGMLTFNSSGNASTYNTSFTSGGTSITLPNAGAAYLVHVSLYGAVSASSIATLTMNSSGSNVFVGGNIATVQNTTGSATNLTVSMAAIMSVPPTGNSVSFTLTNMAAPSNGSVLIRQIV